jgi:uncharacterized membrane protein
MEITMATLRRADWLIPVGLFVLALLPLVPGALRLLELGGGPQIMPANARISAIPLPAVIHIVGAIVYCLVGALQFSPGLRRAQPRLHRWTGRLVWPFGLAVALSALWMTLLYPPAEEIHPLLSAFRLGFGGLMLLALLLGLAAILRRDVPAHRAWMIRAYAVGLGAATQALVFIPAALVMGTVDPFGNALLMGLGWAINLGVAEWIIRRPVRRPNALAAA